LTAIAVPSLGAQDTSFYFMNDELSTASASEPINCQLTKGLASGKELQ